MDPAELLSNRQAKRDYLVAATGWISARDIVVSVAERITMPGSVRLLVTAVKLFRGPEMKEWLRRAAPWPDSFMNTDQQDGRHSSLA